MMRVDGCDHGKGPSAYDNTRKSKAAGQDGEFAHHMAEAYEAFEDPSAWAHYQRWTVERAGEANAKLRGDNERKSLAGVAAFWPRCRSLASVDPKPLQNNPWLHLPFYETRVNCSDKEVMYNTKEHVQYKSTLLKWVFDQYYAAIDAILPSCDTTDGSCVRKALPHLTKLWAGMAEVHPFKDANSRTRQLVLNTELVRLGGHPVIMGDAYWRLYYSKSLKETEWLILNGWCNWEFAVRTGMSPYIPVKANIVSYHNVEYLGVEGPCGDPRSVPYPAKGLSLLAVDDDATRSEWSRNDRLSTEEVGVGAMPAQRSSCTYEPAIAYFGKP